MFADGANALTGLAQALGNYTGYITTNNDGRGIATGFLVKAGTTATNGRLIGNTAIGNWSERERVRPLPGQAVRPRAVRARPQEGRLSFTALSNHFASQSHQTQCRDRRGGVRAQRGRDAAAGRQERPRGGRPQRLRVLRRRWRP